ncbi:MAG: hypothetical protein JST29_05640 [Bacteroidetes bacterium]|nr:hypothetical protein [Bacteroidota bacterium]
MKQAIINKYGKSRYALGLEITARWVAFETKKTCTMETVQAWVNNQQQPTLKQYMILQKLFGKQNF